MYFFKYFKLLNDKILIRQFKTTICKECNKRRLSNSLHVKILQQFTGSSQDKIEEALRPKRMRGIYYLSETELLARIKNIKDLNISGSHNLHFLPLLKVFPVTIRNRVMVLEESGFTKDGITISVIQSYLFLVKSVSIKILKQKQLLEDIDVMGKMLEYIDLDKKHHPEPIGDDATIVDVRRAILYSYLKHRIKMTEENLVETKDHMKRLRHKSLRNLKENIELSEKVIGLPIEKIASNPFLLFQNTVNTRRILNEVKEIGGISIANFLRAVPKITSGSIENMKGIINILNEHKISPSPLISYKMLFTLKADNIRSRIEDLENHEFLSACKNHPRIYDLIFYSEKIKKRLKLLDEIRMHSATVNTLVADKKVFDKYYDQGMDRVPGRDTVFLLCNELNCEKSEIRMLLNKHPFWVHIPIVNIKKILYYLKQSFTKEEILKNIHILLYPIKKIEAELEMLEKRPELNEYKIDGQIRHDMVLPLVVYYLEKANNFTCVGVWDYDAEIQSGIDMPKRYEKIRCK